ncbi:MAG TPA: hypothetical protein HA257_01230 [Candidatus Methanoperedenaceae archaeon]|nr:hypothetical protein [Candidatus Methanoperedenaceae archaeon]
MNLKRLVSDESAVTITIRFILKFSVTVIALMLLLFSFQAMLQRAEETVMRSEMEVIGSDIALRISGMDMAITSTRGASGSVNVLEHEFAIPNEIAGNTYYIVIRSYNEIDLKSDEVDVETRIPFKANTAVTTSTIYSSTTRHRIIYNQSSGAIEVI